MGLSLRTFAGFEKSLFQSARIVLILRHHVRQQEGLLRRRGQRREARQDRHGAPLRRDPADVRELSRAVHWREGVRLQGLQLPPRHPQLHVPGRRLHRRERHWRQVHLRNEVRGRELPAEAHRPWHPFHGQRRPQHQRKPVLPVHRQDLLARRQARRLRAGRRGHGHRQEGRILRVPERQDLQEDYRRRLWRVLGPRLRNLYEEENKKMTKKKAKKVFYEERNKHCINGFSSHPPIFVVL